MEEDNYYKILKCNENASIDEIKRNYKKLALSCHPDKNPSSGDSTEEFTLISRAAAILRDETAKFRYDSSLLDKKTKKIINEEINFEDLKFDECNDEYYYDCRCGGKFLLSSNYNLQLTQNGNNSIVIDCDSCSLSVNCIKIILK